MQAGTLFLRSSSAPLLPIPFQLFSTSKVALGITQVTLVYTRTCSTDLHLFCSARIDGHWHLSLVHTYNTLSKSVNLFFATLHWWNRLFWSPAMWNKRLWEEFLPSKTKLLSVIDCYSFPSSTISLFTVNTYPLVVQIPNWLVKANGDSWESIQYLQQSCYSTNLPIT